MLRAACRRYGAVAQPEKAWLREGSASYKKRKAVRSVHSGCPKSSKVCLETGR